MELLTDILAIFGWALFGYLYPLWVIAKSENTFTKVHCRTSSLAFGLIAASLVLG